MIQVYERIMELITEALEEINNSNSSLSAILRKAIRIARLRNDYQNLWWLEYEMILLRDVERKKQLGMELSPHFTKEEFERTKHYVVESYITERTMVAGEAKDEICALSVPEIEEQINYFKIVAENDPDKGNRFFAQEAIHQYNLILARIRQRVYDYLSDTEKQVLYGQIESDIFERNRIYVEERLKTISPMVIEQLRVATHRLSEKNSESKSHALLSCRRALKFLADAVYPAKSEPVIGFDGKKHDLTDDKYINRLLQYIFERLKKSYSSDLLIYQLTSLDNRIKALYNLANKGVHEQVNHFEVIQCVLQTYVIIGDILRLIDQDFAEEDEICDL